jgi:hypothetical protein
MIRSIIPAVLVFIFLGAPLSINTQTKAPAKSTETPQALVKKAIATLGGEEVLRALKSIQIDKIGHTYWIEQSERPDGPWLVDYRQVIELRDYANQRLSRNTQTRGFQNPQFQQPTGLRIENDAAAFVFGERSGPASKTELQEAQEVLELSAERVLLTALTATDLRLEAGTLMQGTKQKVVAFSWRDGSVRLYLNAATSMPTAIEVRRSYPRSVMRGMWGDVTTRIYLSLWTLEKGGLRYPRQCDIEHNGTPFQSFTVTALTLNPTLEDKSFAITDDVKKVFRATAQTSVDGLPLAQPQQAIDIAPNIIQIPGAWNVGVVRQPDGIIIIEGPITSGYSGKIISEVKRRYPGEAIKAVVTTSDAWPHIGGIREYVALNIPIYILDLNQPILERLINASYRSQPDSLFKQPRQPKFRVVSGKTVIGSGTTSLELYPIRSESGERMMIGYFPAQKLLYSSDLIQRQRDGSFFMPEYLLELTECISREKLEVNNLFGMHIGLTPWRDIETAIAKTK